MSIQLKQLVPIPLKDKFSSRQSNIWSENVLFAKGEWIKIIAPSGTGKTTLMNILYKLRHDYDGQVNWSDKDLKDIAGSELATMRQQKVSVIFQDLRLFENLTARENIELNRVLQKPYYETGAIDEMAAMVGISNILDQKAGICSYGEQQRIAIVRALVQPFDWLLMDEPFSHLDIANTEKAAKLIAAECKKRDAGFVLTDLDEDTHFPYTNMYRL
ncbi:MAG TPA: ATP-binding cassette domain-containing protein [Segetibacter sp.]|jgi:putative ABC transport system ATP-binding protein